MRQVSASIDEELFIRLGAIVARKKVQDKMNQGQVIAEALEEYVIRVANKKDE